MPELILTDIPDTVSSALMSLAADKGLTLEEFVKRLICDRVAIASVIGSKDITITQLQGNTDAYLRLSEHQPIFIIDEVGERFVLISAGEFDRLTKSEDR